MANTVVQPPVANVGAITDPVYQYSSDNGFFSASFAQTIGTADAVKFTTNGYSFGWKPQNVIYVDSAGNMDVVFGVNAQATAQVYKNRVTYVGTSQITSDAFECHGNELKHTIQMIAPPRIPAGFVGTPVQMASGGVITYDSRLSVYADGQTQTTDFEVTGDIGFKDADGNLIYKLPMITVEDANGQSTTGTYKVTFNADGTISFYGMVPWDFLQTAAYPVVIDPTVIVSSAYDTSGNGGRKIVRLVSNTLITAVNDSSGYLRIYKSLDNGQTWTQLTNLNVPGYTWTSWAIATNGTLVDMLATNNKSTNPALYYYQFNESGTFTSGTTSPESIQQTSFGSGVSLAIDGTGVLHAAWCSKNSTYPNSFNIRYSKSTDGGTTWATPTRITSQNTSGYDYTNPCIAVKSNNYPVIAYQTHDTVYGINLQTFNGTSWASNTVYYLSSYAQSNPCVAVDTNDYIHVTWHGEDATYTATNQIKYSKSTDGGTTWSVVTNLTTVTTSAQHQQYPSVTINPSNNDLYVLWSGIDSAVNATYYNIRKIVYTGGAWGSITTITNNTTASDSNPQTLWSKFNMNSSDAIRYIWQDNQVASVKYDSTTLNSPPNAPTLTAHGNFDATVAQTLTWTFSDPDSGNTQSAYQLQIVDTSNNTVVVDTGKVGSTSSSYSLAANTLTNGKSYQWRVQTWDQSGAQGPYSGYSTFSTSAAPVASVTAPASGGTVTSDSYTFTGSYSQPNGVVEQSFQFKLWDSTGATLVQDSGTIVGTSNAKTFNSLANNTSYKVEFIVTSQDGVSATSGKQSFSVAYTPPATPTVTTTNMYADASVFLTIDNPAPTGSEPVVSSNVISRRKVGDTTWRQLKTGVTATDPTFTRNSVAYDPNTLESVASGVPRYVPGKYGNGIFIEEGTTNLFPSANASSFSTAWTSGTLNGTYTVSIQGSGNGSLTLTGGATGTVNVGQSLTFSVTNATVTFTPTGTPTDCQLESKGYQTSWIDGGSTRNAETLTLPSSVLNASEGTIAGWFYEDGVHTAVRHLLDTDNVSGSRMYLYKDPDGHYYFNFNFAGNPSFIGSTIASVGIHHYALKWNVNNVSFYLDGVLKTTVTLTSAVSFTGLTSLYIDSSYNGSVQWNNWLDDFAIWNRALTDNEIASIYNSATSLAMTSDMMTLLHFDSTLQATRTYRDYTCPLGTYEYGVTGVSSAGATSDYGTSQVTTSFTGEWVVDESNSANNVVFLYNQRESDATVNQSYNAVQTFAKYPRIRKGQARYRTGNLTALKLSQDGDVISQVDAIDAMCNSDNTYLLKSVNGRIYRVSLSNFKYTGKYGNSIADVSVQWTEVGDV